MNPAEYTTWALEPEPRKCGSCGQLVETLAPCAWDHAIQVGRCCEVYIDLRCPDCGSDNLDWREYDFGTCSETGYRDAGYKVICHDCGSQSGEGDLLRVKIGPYPAYLEGCPECGTQGVCDCGPGKAPKPKVVRKPVQTEFHAKLAEALRPTGTDDEEEVF